MDDNKNNNRMLKNNHTDWECCLGRGIRAMQHFVNSKKLADQLRLSEVQPESKIMKFMTNYEI